jgi:very-short-patch-repair endonuclease
MAANTQPDRTASHALVTRLHVARQDLLDLGLRNSLLKYRPLRARSVEVVGESPAEVFRILMREGKRMTFQPAPEARQPALAMPEEPSSALEQPEESPEDMRDAQLYDTHLQTSETSGQLQARLLKTYHAARTVIEEQGANILYLALGMLEWYESDASQEPRSAPLVLVPVQLDRTNALDRFHLSWNDDDIGANLSLAAKLQAEFAIHAPDMPAVEDLDVDTYFDAYEAAIASQPRWRIARERIVLSFFSFGKFLMYRDLDTSVWQAHQPLAEHPLLRALLSPEGFSEPPAQLDDEAFIDPFLRRSEIHEVVDADSSQTLAILDVNAGRNLVIQGPPGTGKSQTITNIIAEAIGTGKTVLFVAEKMAALEVVKRRLDTIGLGDACLELHSHKINKRTVLAELRRTLELGRPRLTDLANDLALLEDYRERLNAYCDAVNTPIGASGVSPYQAYGHVVRLTPQATSTAGEQVWPRVDLPDMATWDGQQFTRRAAIVSELQARLAAMDVPVEHPFWGSRKRIVLPSDRDRIAADLAAARDALQALREAILTVSRLLRLAPSVDRSNATQLLDAARRVQTVPALSGVAVASREWVDRMVDLRLLVIAGTHLRAIRSGLDSKVTPDAWLIDLTEVRQVLTTNRTRWWRGLSPSYRRAKGLLAGLCTGGLPNGIVAQLELTDDLLDAQRQQRVLEQHSDLAGRLFGPHWRGTDSDWRLLHDVTEWLIALHLDIDRGALPRDIVATLTGPTPNGALTQGTGQLAEALAAWDERSTTLLGALEFDPALRYGSRTTIEHVPLADLTTLLAAWAARLGDLPQMAAWNVSAEACRQEGMESVLHVAERWPLARAHLFAAFALHWYNVLLERAWLERPQLAQFDASSHEHVVARFRELDRTVFEHNRARLAVEHWQRLPRHEGGGQLATLRREFEKRSRHLPIRQLMERAGNAIQAIKPVFMMGPLSIATYIPPGSITFDLIVFDEASQVRPVDAFGALLRGSQAVVVGDSRQLPPTSFFDTLIDHDDDDLEERPGDVESILGLFAAQNAPQRMLRWHYRSRHESLIAVSNREFYESRLIVFPSPDAAREEAGLVLHHLANTAYDRGGSRTNREEAATVARAVMEHARTRPHLTLGVAAFSNAQTDAILTEVERLRRADPSLEPFFAAHEHEPFFIKNLENVQGDERDVIYISIGYGRAADGHLSMNFGPLNAEGGERRLNVLITRARLRCEVFTNLTAEDIDLRRTSARGVVALKQFLHFAQTGQLDSPLPTGRDMESPFEEAVHAALRGAGYEVQPQVGTAGFFVDLAVVDPDRPGRYLLAVECDGATYHSARSARDRDRLRQQVLEGLGWRFHRIWSTDWFRNPERELRRVVEAIETARAHGATIPVPSRITTEITREDEPVAPAAPTSAPPYELATPRITLGNRQLAAIPPATMAKWATQVVEVESPVHAEEVARRIMTAAGVARSGNRIRAAIEAGINDAALTGRVIRRGAFLWHPAMATPPVRDRSLAPSASRSIALIAPEEIEQAILRVVTEAYGIPPDYIPPSACRLLGFARLTDELRAAVVAATDRLLVTGRLREQSGHVVVGDE